MCRSSADSSRSNQSFSLASSSPACAALPVFSSWWPVSFKAGPKVSEGISDDGRSAVLTPLSPLLQSSPDVCSDGKGKYAPSLRKMVNATWTSLKSVLVFKWSSPWFSLVDLWVTQFISHSTASRVSLIMGWTKRWRRNHIVIPPCLCSNHCRTTIRHQKRGPIARKNKTANVKIMLPYFSTKPGSIETNPTLVVEVSNVKLISI